MDEALFELSAMLVFSSVTAPQRAFLFLKLMTLPGTYIVGTESWHAERRDGEGSFGAL